MSRPTQVPPGLCDPISPTGLSPAMARFSKTLRLSLHTGTVDGPTTPADALPHPRFGLLRVRSPLLAQSLLLSFPPGTEMFQFPGLTPHWEVSGSLPTGCPIRTSADHGAFASPRGFSQLITSFVASESHRHPPCALSCFLVSFAYMTLLLQVRSILVTSEKVCFNFLGESLYSFCNSSFAFPACQ